MPRLLARRLSASVIATLFLATLDRGLAGSIWYSVIRLMRVRICSGVIPPTIVARASSTTWPRLRMVEDNPNLIFLFGRINEIPEFLL